MQEIWKSQLIPVNMTDRNKNGNKDGITTRIHSSTPLCAPARAVFASRISTVMASTGSNVIRIFLADFMSITSEESMRALVKSSLGAHKLDRKGVLS